MTRPELERRVEALMKNGADGPGWRKWHGRICHEVTVRSDVGDLQLIRETYAEAADRLQKLGYAAHYEEVLELADGNHRYYRIGVAIGR